MRVQQLIRHTSSRWLPLILVLAGLVPRMWNATRSLGELVDTTIPDDSFYYFSIARNVVLGNPPSIDGVNPTNGYHPLWMAVLAFVYWLVGAHHIVAPIRVALIISGILDAASGWLIFRVCRRLELSVGASVFALTLFLANPREVVNATDGLETSIALFFLLLLFLVFVGDAERKSLRPALVGVLAGLTVLGRTDHVIIVACLYADRVVSLARTSGMRAAARWGGIATSVALLVFLPWAAYSLRTTGTLVQSSGIVLAYINRRMPEVWGFDPPGLALTLARHVASFNDAALQVIQWQGLSVAAAFAVLAGVVALAVTARGEAKDRLRRRARRLAPLVGGVTLLFVAHAVGRLVFREWYTAPFLAVNAIGLAVFVEHASCVRPLQTGVATVGILAAWMAFNVRDWFSPWYGQKLAGSVIPNLHEGHSDCGVMSYFSEQGITNLDGIVNQRALEALLSGDLFSYIKEQRFQRVYMSDYYHSSVFFGPRYRESIVIQDDPRAIRVVNSALEKDARIGPSDGEISFGDTRGREYLDDGWLWDSIPGHLAQSLGPRSELLLYVPRSGDESALDLRLVATMTNEHGVQPIDVFLEDRPVAHFDVTPIAAVYTVPLKTAAPGRNRIRLEYRAARAERADSVGWWSSLTGYPIRAIEAQAIWLHHGGQRQAFDFPLVGEGAPACEGCYDPETNDQGGFRWTNGHAKLTLVRLPVKNAAECRLEVAPGSATYKVRWNGVALPGAHGSYLVLPEARERAGETHTVEIASRVFVPKDTGESTDDRKLGVPLERLQVFCWY